MSNLHPYGAAKNPPWAQATAAGNLAQTNRIQQQLMSQQGGMNPAMVPFQQQQPQVFQTMTGMTGLQQQQQQSINLGLQQMGGLGAGTMFQQVATVSYPNPRALNPTAFQTSGMSSVSVPQNNQATSTKQRVFTGTVTKIHDNFGFVDEDVFFQVDACVKGSNPGVGDRVLVEATYNLHMPFKWNATRIQVLPKTGPGMNSNNRNSNQNKSGGYNANSYNAVPPPSDNANGGHFGGGLGSGGRNQNRNKGGNRMVRDRSPIRERDGGGSSAAAIAQRNAEDEAERKRRRDERMREREKEDKKVSPARRRSRSPKRRRTRVVPRYMVQIPKIALDMKYADVLETRRRYNNLYIPSDFFSAQIRWIDAFPAEKPFTLTKPCSFLLMHKTVESVSENDAILEPSDADYSFSAKVMLMSIPGMDEIYQRTCALAEDKHCATTGATTARQRRSTSQTSTDPTPSIAASAVTALGEHVHPTRLINFLVGVRGKNETMAIGGPWSKSLDGPNPDRDPSVLIRTAVRCCKALTGVDLSHCTKWYRFVELYYRRSGKQTAGGGGGGDSEQSGKGADGARVETVVLFLPDVWSCLPTRLEWDTLQTRYRDRLEVRLQPKQQAVPAAAAAKSSEVAVTAVQAGVEDADTNGESTLEPTHYSNLDVKTLTVSELRDELNARGINSKGLKSQLIARLNKAVKTEMENDQEADEEMEDDDEKAEDEKVEDGSDNDADISRKEVVEEKKLDDKEKAVIEKRYTLPEEQHILVHPSRSAKNGKFDCLVMSLSVLLDYRREDTKEHSYEVSLFAELFNEMLMRDFGFNIYRALYDLPEVVKPKEDKKDKDKEKDKDKDKRSKDDDKKEGSSSKTDDKDKKKDKKDKDKDKDDKRSERGESDGSDIDDDDKKSTKDKKKRERVKMFTKDRNLLLSFIYFDQTHCGYLFEKDIEDLLYTLGLSLSRAQVRHLVGKVVTRDSLHYRKLTDKPKEDDFIIIDDSEKDANLIGLAAGNKKLLPVFKELEPPEKKRKLDSGETSTDNAPSETGLVMYRGALVDVAKLQTQLERSDKARLDAETRMVDLKAENAKLTERYSKSGSTIKQLSSEAKEAKEKLRNSEETLHRITACSKLFKTTLVEIRDKIDPVLYSTANKEDTKRESDRKEETKSRWEKEKEKDKKSSSPSADASKVDEKEIKVKVEIE